MLLKTCSRKNCKQQNPQSITEFNKLSKSIDGVAPQCRHCAKEIRDLPENIKTRQEYEKSPKRLEAVRKRAQSLEFKKVQQTYLQKPETIEKKRQYFQSSEYKSRRSLYNKTPERRKIFREQNLKKYWPNLTRHEAVLEYNKMLHNQDFKCDICRIHQDCLKNSLCVDHCHLTGKVRSLLCHTCNIIIGLFKEDICFIDKAKLYLIKHK